MNRLIIILFLLAISVSLRAQKDTTIVLPKNDLVHSEIQKSVLTQQQQQWLYSNYRKLGSMSKQNATGFIRENFATMSEASLEFIISLAGRLMQADQSEQLQQMKTMLAQLKSQKSSIMDKIKKKEAEYGATTDELKKAKLAQEIMQLKSQLARVEQQISAKEDAIRKLDDD